MQTLGDILTAKLPFPAYAKPVRWFTLANYCFTIPQQEHIMLLLPPLHLLFQSIAIYEDYGLLKEKEWLFGHFFSLRLCNYSVRSFSQLWSEGNLKL